MSNPSTAAERSGFADPAVTDGCSWNGAHSAKCTPPHKSASASWRGGGVREIRRCGEQFGVGLKRVFLADGDAMTLSPVARGVLAAIRRDLPGVRRVSSYCLRAICARIGGGASGIGGTWSVACLCRAESGDDEVLARVNKGETFATTREALESCKRRDQTLGDDPQRLGGQTLSRQHALNSAALINAANPNFSPRLS